LVKSFTYKWLFPKGYIMSNVVKPEPEPLWLQLFNAITARQGMKRSELITKFKHKAKAKAINSALTLMYVSKIPIYKGLEATGGRPAECWWTY
jgi:hypothetical protein